MSTDADWGTPGWTCLRFTLVGSSQRFQYQVKTEPAAKAFTLVARGPSRDRSRIVEIVQSGVVKADRVEMAPPVRRELAP